MTKLWRDLHPKVQLLQWRKGAFCTGLPDGLPIKANLGDPVVSLQPAIDTATPLVDTTWTKPSGQCWISKLRSSQLCQSPLGTHWPTGARPFLSNRQSWACPSKRGMPFQNVHSLPKGARPSKRKAPFLTYQAKLGMPFQKGHALPKVASPSKRGAPFPIHQTVCQELRMDGGIAKPGPAFRTWKRLLSYFEFFPAHLLCQKQQWRPILACLARIPVTVEISEFSLPTFPAHLPCQKQQWRPILACLARIPVTVEVSEYSLPTFSRSKNILVHTFSRRKKIQVPTLWTFPSPFVLIMS